MKYKTKKPRCHNCKFAEQQFKIKKLTHLHCEDPKKYTQEKFDNGEFCAWDTLRVFNDTCDNHEFKPLKKNNQMKIQEIINFEINDRIDRLEKNIRKGINVEIMEGVLFELQDLKNYISELLQNSDKK